MPQVLEQSLFLFSQWDTSFFVQHIQRILLFLLRFAEEAWIGTDRASLHLNAWTGGEWPRETARRGNLYFLFTISMKLILAFSRVLHENVPKFQFWCLLPVHYPGRQYNGVAELLIHPKWELPHGAAGPECRAVHSAEVQQWWVILFVLV